MSQVLIACVGGFLGSGKTTALASAARELTSRRLKVGIITNDQGEQLIDTHVMRALGLATEEITGGCFCCKFTDLVEQAERILDRRRPDIILAEAVGSCTDLSATVYQPLRKYYASQFDLAPLTILVEPCRVNAFTENLTSPFPDDVSYLFKKQLSEADLIVLNKCDLLKPGEQDNLAAALRQLVGDIPLHEMSARTGRGVAGWVDHLLSGRTAGARILEIDYQTYAQAEAALGWLNATADMTSSNRFSPGKVGETLIDLIRDRCIEEDAAIAHLKILVVTPEGSDRIALVESHGEAHWSDERQFAATSEISLIINARVRTHPEKLRQIVESSIAGTAESLGIRSSVQHMESFSPSPPRPTYRFKEATAS